jgi:predicted transposase/invertase (TIGR01784 family)
MPDIPSPHDRFFKAAFSRPEIAADFLRHYLPAPVAGLLDLRPEALRLRPGSFIDRRLRHRASDLLFEARFRDGRPGLVYLLMEHKSYADRWVAHQLLGYMVDSWRAETRRGKHRRLLPIIPVVVYHGRTAWQTPTTFGALFDVPVELRVYVPDFAFQVTDLSMAHDAAIREVMAALRTVLLTLREGPYPRLVERLDEVFATLAQVADRALRKEIAMLVLSYIAQVNAGVTEEELAEALERALPESGGDTMPTLAETWRQQGIERGRQEGRQEGRREGLISGIELALDLKFGALGLALMPEIRAINDATTLQAVHAAIRAAVAPEDVRAVYALGTPER